MPDTRWRSLAESSRERIVDFGERLLRAPSLSSQEGQAADLVAREMRRLGYDAVHVDEAGNVVGKLSGGGGRSTMLHAHMDVVDPGDPADWTHPPFSGQRAEGHLWARGASDDKGCVVAQVYAGGLLREAGIQPPGDVYVVAVVNEETGGAGTRHLLRYLRPDVAIIGEPSGNTIRRGHRGRFEFIITWHGRSAHASAPERGVNPHFSMARFLLALRDTPLMQEPVFGGTTVVPTLSYVDQTSSNVIPAQASVHLDWRNAPGETLEDADSILRGVLARTVDPDVRVELHVRSHTVTTYTGHQERVQHDVGSFLLDLKDPLLRAAHQAVEDALERPVELGVWTFCTDGGFVYAAGVPCIGFGPGEETMAHVRDERIEVNQLVEAVAGYMALACRMGDPSLY
ncbi:MAG: M20/M25/M40 family metallo-hydrolase [Anaerolineae bacterium]|nr:M20/M25/M40 family metallo-hydrolase [Anaerolineae bacterium]